MIWTAIKSYFACAWSAFSYIPPWGKMPADKPSYWANCLGFNDPSPELLESWQLYKGDPSFHRLKDIGVEWTQVWPQRAFKITALAGVLLALQMLVIGLVVGVLI